MKIVKLEMENVKRVRAVEITPTGSMVVLGGDNAQGKSSILDGIMVAIGGNKYKDVKMVRDGKKKGFIDLDFGDMQIRRTFTESGGGTLVVTGKDGEKMTSPQSVLSGLIGAVSFDPLSFADAGEKEQGNIIKDLSGLDLSDMDSRRAEAYDERTMVNRETKRYQAELNSLEFNEDVKYETPLSAIKVLAEIDANEKVRADYSREYEYSETLVAKIDENTASIATNTNMIADLEKEIEALKKQTGDLHIAYDANKRMLEESNVKQGKLLEKMADPQSLKDKLATIEDHNKINASNNTYKDQEVKILNSVKLSEEYTAKIAAIDAEREALIQSVKMPIAGLSFNSDGLLLYQGIPFSQASSAEKIRVSVAIGIAMNPDLKVLLIRNGSLLDDKNLKMISKMAELKDAQLWVETVGKKDNCSIIMEDGFSRDPESIQ